MTKTYEPGKIYLCLTHRHPGHFFVTVRGAWRFYDRVQTQWLRLGPEESCELMIFEETWSW